MGSEQRLEYSMVGDTVNVAARLESGTKGVGAPILVSRNTAAAAKSFIFVPLGELPLKGKSRPEPVFALHAKNTGDLTDFNQFLELHEKAVHAIDTDQPDAADAVAAACATSDGARYASFYEKRLAGHTPELVVTKNPGGS